MKKFMFTLMILILLCLWVPMSRGANVEFKGDKLTNGTLQGVTTIQLHAAPAVTSRPTAGVVFTWLTVDRDGNMVINYRGATGDDKVYTGVLWSALTSVPSIITSIANQASLQTLNTALQAYDADIMKTLRTKTLATLKTTLDSYSDEINTATFAIGTQAVQSRTVSVTLKTAAGAAISHAGVVDVYLSDASTGLDIAATAPSGGVAIGSAGKVLAAITAGKLIKVVTNATGGVDLILTENTAKSFYICIVLPNGRIIVSSAIAFTAAG